MSKSKKEEIHPMFQDIWRIFHFRCEKCDKSIKYRSQEDIKAKDIICIHCGNDVVKFRDVTTSAFGNISGKVDYISYEKQSAINIKQQGKEKVTQLINADPILKHQVKPIVPWWRDGSIEGTIKSEKVLNQTQLKQAEQKIKEIGGSLGDISS